jgi:hypothetical protein
VSNPEFDWQVRVTAGHAGAAVFVRTRRFEVGVPLSFDREEPGITALEYVLGAIGADLVVGLQRAARRRRVELDAVEATVHAALRNPLSYLGVVGEEGDPGIRSLRVRVYAITDAAADAVERIWQETLATSPLANTFGHAVQLELTCKTQV